MDQRQHHPGAPQQHFDHDRLDAWRVAFEALVEGDRLSKAAQGASPGRSGAALLPVAGIGATLAAWVPVLFRG